MKKMLTIILFAAAFAAADDMPQNLPKGAVQVEPNLYRYTDAHGKTWLTRRTPFGFSTWEDKPAPLQPAVQTSSAPLVRATDLGDTVRFERQTPFGMSKWVRKKSELTDEEKGWFAAAQHPNSAPPAASSPARATEGR